MKKISILLFFLLIVISCSNKDLIEEIVVLPKIETNPASEINVLSVKLGFKIIDEGDFEIIELGLVKSFTPAPTIENNIKKYIFEKNDTNQYSILDEYLPAESKINYVRAYVINSQGITYGNEIKFQSLGNNVYLGDVILSNQEEVKEFGNNAYNTINGFLFIKDNVSDLSPLKDLYTVSGLLRIINTNQLKNLKGLENLNRIESTGDFGLELINNSSFENFEGLNNLEKIKGELNIRDNQNLKNFYGFGKSFSIEAGSITIQNCDNLKNLEGLEKLVFLENGLFLYDNNSLENISHLKNAKNLLGTVQIHNNSVLSSLNGLESLKNISSVILKNNPLLSNLNGINNVESLNSLYLYNNENLTTLPKFNKLKTIYDIDILSGNKIKNLTGLENIENINSIKIKNADIESLLGLSKAKIRTLEIHNCLKFKNFIGIENINEVTFLSVTNCPTFESLEGFNLKAIDELKLGGLNITSLKGLESLQTVNSLSISSNNNLENTTGIDNIENINILNIFSNPKLETIENFIKIKSLKTLNINANYTLENLNGFNNLESITTFSLRETNLSDLSDLKSLTYLQNFSAEYNANLKDYCSLVNAFKNIVNGNYNVHSNAYNPSKNDLENGKCN